MEKQDHFPTYIGQISSVVEQEQLCRPQLRTSDHGNSTQAILTLLGFYIIVSVVIVREGTESYNKFLARILISLLHFVCCASKLSSQFCPAVFSHLLVFVIFRKPTVDTFVALNFFLQWKVQHATPCFNNEEVHCGIPLHRLCSKDRPHVFLLKLVIARHSFPIVSDAMIEHGSTKTIESFWNNNIIVFPYNRPDRLTANSAKEAIPTSETII